MNNMKRKHFIAVLFLLLGLLQSQVSMAQTSDLRGYASTFEEYVFYAYALQQSEAFELQLDASSILEVVPLCDASQDMGLDAFLKEKRIDFQLYNGLEKEDFGVLFQQWCAALPEDIYFAMVKQENMRAISQNNYCHLSEPFCTDNGMYEFPAGVNAGSGEPGPNYNCLGSTPNPAWYYLRILDSGNMDIYMYSVPQVDIDFCCWGPFDDPFEPCPSGLTGSKVVSCSYSPNWNETCRITNAEHGDYYILLITNYSNRTCNINFSKVAGDATTDCSILPPLVGYNSPVCAGQDLTLFANGNEGSEFHWFLVGGSWTSNEQNPVRPNATPEMSGTYGCAITRNGSQSDTTYVEVVVSGNYFYVSENTECDTVYFNGEVFTESGLYEFSYVTDTGCDSIVELSVDMNYTPHFEIQGAHWPIGGSETYISVNEYFIQLENPATVLDTVLWEVDCDHWRIEPHGKGETCTLYIHSYLLDPVMLHAAAVNRCDTIREVFFIQTSYFDTDEYADEVEFEVLPNPTTGHLNLRFGRLQGLVEMQLYNSQGQQVDTFVVDASISHEKVYVMPETRNGLYYLVLKNREKTLIRKVVLQR